MAKNIHSAGKSWNTSQNGLGFLHDIKAKYFLQRDIRSKIISEISDNELTKNFVVKFVDYTFSCSADQFGITIINNPYNENPLGMLLKLDDLDAYL